MKVLLVLLAGLSGVGVAVDRIGAGIAENRVADEVAVRGDLAGKPSVDIRGFPFLTQAVAGRYSDVRIGLTAEQLGQPAGTRADVRLRGVHVPLSAVLSGSVAEVPVDRIEGTATLSYALLAEQLGGDATLRPEGDRLRITRTVSVLGNDVPVTAAGTLALDGADLVVDVREAAAAGVDVPGFVLDLAAELLDFRYAVPELPLGLQVTGVRPESDGVHIGLQARDTVLRG